MQTIELKKVPKLSTKILVNIADPDTAITAGMLPVEGVGLARLEFIITNVVQVHPMALIHSEKILDESVKNKINEITCAYENKKQFFVDTVAYGIGMIAAAFYPRPVIVRLSDFKTNEYRNLIGGVYFEPLEENPMLGFRGASRYYNAAYKEAFALECAALKKVCENMGFDNVKIMVPFVRTVAEGCKVIEAMRANGLEQKNHGLQIIMMCEIPSNVLLIDQFSKIFDGFSIGSNDLTQLTLGVDRDSHMLASLFDERDEAVQKFLTMAIQGAHAAGRPIGICGQAPSDYPEIAQFLIAQGIDSISLNIDSVLPFLESL
jgi:pyruvate,water dikinase